MIMMHTATERPDLWARGIDSAAVWPEYNLHGDVLNQWWQHLDAELGDFQFVLYDEDADAVVAEGHTGPFWWDGEDPALPDGIDSTLELVFAQRRAGAPVNTLCALAAETPREGRRRGLAVQLLTAMRELAQRQGLTHLVAPVRPSWKERYPLTPIDTYVGWRRADGQLLDPWMRVHQRLGARSRRRCRGRCGSPARSRSGSHGPGWFSLSPGTMSFLRDWPPCALTSPPTRVRTGNPMCGWCIPT